MQYSGLKYSDDDSDARWLAKLLRLGLLPEGYIYPKEERAVRDLLRRRSRLVQQHTANLLAVQNLFARNRGQSLSANEVKRLTPEAVSRLLPDPNLALAVQSTLLVMRGQEAAIDLLEREALAQVRLRPAYRHLLSVSGIGQVLGLTILLETGPIDALRRGRALRLLLPLRGQRAAVQRQAQGPRQHQERQQVPGLGLPGGGQLRGALQRRDQALLPAQAGQDQRHGRHQDRRPQAGPGLLLHPARRHRLRRESGLRLNRFGAVAATHAKGVGPRASRSEWAPPPPPKRHGGLTVTETPLPASQPGVGRRPRGAEPAICEPAARRGRGGCAGLLGVRAPAPPRLRGPLGPWWGTDDFLGLPRARGRVSMPNGHGPIALIQKGDWCGSEIIRHRCRENRRRVPERLKADVAGQKACSGTRKFVVLLIGVS